MEFKAYFKCRLLEHMVLSKQDLQICRWVSLGFSFSPNTHSTFKYIIRESVMGIKFVFYQF